MAMVLAFYEEESMADVLNFSRVTHEVVKFLPTKYTKIDNDIPKQKLPNRCLIHTLGMMNSNKSM